MIRIRLISAILALSTTSAFGAGIECRKDRRPVDGPMVAYSVSEEGRGFTLTRTSTVFDMRIGKVRQSKDLLHSNMNCLSPVAGFRAGSPIAYFCQLDRRPVDGPVHRLSILQNTLGTYTLTMETGVGPNLAGPERTSSSEVLGEGFSCKLN